MIVKTHNHKPTGFELARVQSKGGIVEDKYLTSKSKRCRCLSMTRSLGDMRKKKYFGEGVLIARPDFYVQEVLSRIN